jgi:hypothetical protein
LQTLPNDEATRVEAKPKLAPSTGGTFPSRDRCAQAAQLLHDDYREDFFDDQAPTVRAGDLSASCSISVTPGGLVLRRRLRPEGREAHLDDLDPRTDTAVAVRAFLRGLVVTLGHHIGADAWHGPPEPRRCDSSRWWSDRSRSRMIRCLASVDWTPVFFLPRTRPAMVTLTYPGDWLTVAPDSDTAKGHLRLFHERLRRLYSTNDLGDPPAIWKLEFQHRGAPHFHIYLPAPIAKVTYRGQQLRFRDWVSQTWADVVDHPDDDERARHLSAGTGIDFAEGSRCSDPKRLAVYFTRHNAKGGRSKAHQHRVPEAWVSAGRWWGTWGVERISEEAPISEHELVESKRLLRGWVRSQQRIVPRQVRRVSSTTGEVRSRWVTRRYGVRSLAQSQGGFIIANDGPALAAMLSRYLEAIRSD